MAKTKKENLENLMRAKALVNLKYDSDCFKINNQFIVKSEDFKEMESRGYVELLEELKAKDTEEKDIEVKDEKDLKKGE